MWERISEEEWARKFRLNLWFLNGEKFDFVTGPGRSGAIASVYASHYLGIPFKPHKAGSYKSGEYVLIVDTVEYTGKTLRKSEKWHQSRGLITRTCFALKENKGHYYKMWYE